MRYILIFFKFFLTFSFSIHCVQIFFNYSNMFKISALKSFLFSSLFIFICHPPCYGSYVFSFSLPLSHSSYICLDARNCNCYTVECPSYFAYLLTMLGLEWTQSLPPSSSHHKQHWNELLNIFPSWITVKIYQENIPRNVISGF